MIASFRTLPSANNAYVKGPPASFIAILWMIFSILIVMFPTTPDPSDADMNYTVVVAGGWLLLCVAYYYCPKYGGVYWFKGPISNVELETPVDRMSETYSGEKDGSVSQE